MAKLRGPIKKPSKAERDALARYRALCPPDCDFERANEARVFFEEIFSFSKGEWQGRPFKVEDWQFRDLLCPLFGRLDRQGRRITRTAFLLIPRKNGKTELSAALALFLLLADGEPGAEVYSCGASRDQARICYSMASAMVNQSEVLSSLCTVYKSEIVTHKGGIYRALSAEAGTKHGASASGIIFDEVHAFEKDRELWDVMTTSTAARRTPLTVAISTQSDDEESLCSELYRYSKNVLEARQRGEDPDPAWLPIIYEADREDPWDSEETWRKANPNFGVTVNAEYMKQEADRAKKIPGQLHRFCLLHLNQKRASSDTWLDMEKFRGFAAEPPELAGAVAYGGLDISTNRDLTSFTLAFPLENQEVWFQTFYWVPEGGIADRERRNLPTYRAWADQGYMKLLPGDAIDFALVRADIFSICEKYEVREIAVDRWNAAQLAQEFVSAGLKVIAFGQGFYSMGPASKALEACILREKFFFDGNPVTSFCFGNVRLEYDPAGNFKLSKKASKDRIDGAVSCAMANARLEFNEAPGPSVYATEGLLGPRE